MRRRRKTRSSFHTLRHGGRARRGTNYTQNVRSAITFQHLLLAVSHHVDVLNADELEFNVGVVVFIFVALSCSPVCERVQLEETSGTDSFRTLAVILKGQACYIKPVRVFPRRLAAGRSS